MAGMFPGNRFIVFYCLFCYSVNSYCQPYLDIAKAGFTHSPKKGLNKKGDPLLSDLYSINATLPLEFKKDGDAFIINPFFDHNGGSISGRSFNVQSKGIAIGFLNKFKKNKWALLTTVISRRNKEDEKKLDELWQYGALILTTWNKKPGLSLKLGLYYNKEFFGNFFVPLAGIDWTINEKNNLFGVLPGNIVFEHKTSSRFYWGAAFRAMTNSYRLETIDPCFSGDCSAKNYLRIDDNQLGLFADVYVTKKMVFTAETGYTAFRRYRFGFKGEKLHRYTNTRNDNYYARVSVAYRMRFR
jgi:hypothetical protein